MSDPLLVALSVAPLVGWLYLLAGRGGFWLARPRDDQAPAPPAAWPSIVAVIPARDEADVIGRAVASLLAQDYPASLQVIVVDDQSADGTAARARDAGAAAGASSRLQVVAGSAPPAGWTGKLWAQSQGVARATELKPDYLLLTDADIEHAPGAVRALAARAAGADLVLASLMVELSCETWPERLMIPAFVFFFQMLFPFAWAADPRRSTAAAAGGCMLVRREALARAGGLQAIRGKIIDDCALAALLKAQGPIWLGLSRRAKSLRPYRSLAEIGRMISRSAYAQLRYSPWLLAGTLVGLALIYLAPPLLAAFAPGAARWAGAAAWTLMAVAFQPTLRLYRRSALWGLALPAIGALYALFTVDSAVQVWRGRGGMWKGRAQALAEQA